MAASVGFAGQQILIDVERRDGRTEVRAGYETRTVSLRGARFRMGGSAYGSDWSGGKLNVGIGQNWKEWHFDYAYSYTLRLSGMGGMHRLSVSYWQR